jgi:peptidoglycan hydrolase-like protein with peptidoglycan-binding domain
LKSRIACALVALLVPTSALLSYTPAVALPKPPAPTAPAVSDTLRALAKLHDYGYSIDTPARADRAIRHWQKANHLVIDGLVGTQVLTSLGIAGADATAPAVRLNPPVAVPQPMSVEDIIRSVWPDELEAKALAIAKRESNLQPEVINRNGNATGLFQIMWTVHRGWLCPQMGICAQSQLQDAQTNAEAAYALYQRADAANGARGDGWGPWAL